MRHATTLAVLVCRLF